MRIYFNAMWNGFMDTDPVNYLFFLDLFSKVFNTVCEVGHTIQDSTILIESMFGSIKLVGVKKWDYSFYYSGENYIPCDSRYTAILGGHATTTGIVKLPQIISYMHCNKLFEKFANPVRHTSVPSKFACTIISNPNACVRNAFIKRLEDRGIHVDHGGSYKNNIGGTIPGEYNSPEVASFWAAHKFAITMENSVDDYYITEKICHGLQSGVIPVYWGTPRICEYINRERILQLRSDSNEDMDNLIDRMISMSDAEYLDIVNKPSLTQPDMYANAIKELQDYLARTPKL
jgi:hypothetical protein